MSHNWISCRNAPLLALLNSARAPFPQGVLCCCRSVRRALNEARGSSQTFSLLLNDIPALIQYHTRLSLCLNPSPWTGDLTAPDKFLPQCSHWGTRAGTAELSLVPTGFQHFSYCPAWFPVHFKFQTLILGVFLPVLAILSGDLLQMTRFWCKIHPLSIIKIHSIESEWNIFKIHLLNVNPIPTNLCFSSHTMKWIHLFSSDVHTELMGLGELPGLPREQTPSSILVQGSDSECSFLQHYRTPTDNKILILKNQLWPSERARTWNPPGQVSTARTQNSPKHCT